MVEAVRRTALGSRLGGQDGQVLVLAAVGMMAICGIAGFAIDVGSWYQTQQKQQAIADAAALAAAADLPANTSQATTDAQAYAAKNGGSVSTINFSTKYMADDTITVTAQTTAPSYFLKVIGIHSATVTATAVARADNLGAAYGAAPFGVINTQPELAGPGCPCFGAATTLDETKGPGPGGFGIINIDGSSGGTGPAHSPAGSRPAAPAPPPPPVWLNSDPGAKFNSSQVQSAMNAMVGHTLLFPVYDQRQETAPTSNTTSSASPASPSPLGQPKAPGPPSPAPSPRSTGAAPAPHTEHHYFGATTTQLVG